MKAKIKTVMVLRNLNVAVFDESGRQIPELQVSAASLWAEHAVQCGYDPKDVIIETSYCNWRLVKNADGSWNREESSKW